MNNQETKIEETAAEPVVPLSAKEEALVWTKAVQTKMHSPFQLMVMMLILKGELEAWHRLASELRVNLEDLTDWMFHGVQPAPSDDQLIRELYRRVTTKAA